MSLDRYLNKEPTEIWTTWFACSKHFLCNLQVSDLLIKRLTEFLEKNLWADLTLIWANHTGPAHLTLHHVGADAQMRWQVGRQRRWWSGHAGHWWGVLRVSSWVGWEKSNHRQIEIQWPKSIWPKSGGGNRGRRRFFTLGHRSLAAGCCGRRLEARTAWGASGWCSRSPGAPHGRRGWPHGSACWRAAVGGRRWGWTRGFRRSWGKWIEAWVSGDRGDSFEEERRNGKEAGLELAVLCHPWRRLVGAKEEERKGGAGVWSGSVLGWNREVRDGKMTQIGWAVCERGGGHCRATCTGQHGRRMGHGENNKGTIRGYANEWRDAGRGRWRGLGFGGARLARGEDVEWVPARCSTMCWSSKHGR
jgi:hypothetical protein